MSYYDDIKLGDTLDFKFTTVNTSGVPTTLAGSPVLSAYVGNGTTEITAGITLTVDFDSRTGMHNCRVVASGGNGFAAATNVDIVITAGTVGGNSVVGYVAGSFSIENRPVNADRHGGTAQTGRDIGASVLLSTGTGTGQLDFTSGVVKANLAQILGTALTETAGLLAGGFKKFFNIASPVSTMDVLARVTLTDTVTTYTGNTPQTGDNYVRIGAPAGANVSADILQVKNFVDDIGVAGAGLTNLGDTRIGAIKTQTDKLVFTVANQVDANAITVGDKAGYALASDFRIKKNTGLNNFTFLMVNSSGDPATALSITAQRSLDGGALGAMSNSATEISNGLYKINLAAADTNADFCAYRFSATGAKDRIIAFPTQTE